MQDLTFALELLEEYVIQEPRSHADPAGEGAPSREVFELVPVLGRVSACKRRAFPILYVLVAVLGVPIDCAIAIAVPVLALAVVAVASIRSSSFKVTEAFDLSADP